MEIPPQTGLPENFFFAHFSKKASKPFWAVAALGLIIVFVLFFYATGAPGDFPKNTTFSIATGETTSQVAARLKTERLVRSETLARDLLILLGGRRGVLAGDYYFARSQGVFAVAFRLTRGEFDLVPIKITLPEGLSNRQISRILSNKLTKFDSVKFLAKAATLEGYLFPDTYNFLPNATESEVLTALKNNFDNKIKLLDAKVGNFKRPLKDVIIMASILEEEARTLETRRIIAGILWKRLERQMPLQVDAVFPYIFDREITKVYLEDLNVDSPYNTYKYKGLPPGPISNPGLEAIEAAVTPITTKYYYYLTDTLGVMHYATTHDEHVANKERYLR